MGAQHNLTENQDLVMAEKNENILGKRNASDGTIVSEVSTPCENTVVTPAKTWCLSLVLFQLGHLLLHIQMDLQRCSLWWTSLRGHNGWLMET